MCCRERIRRARNEVERGAAIVLDVVVVGYYCSGCRGPALVER